MCKPSHFTSLPPVCFTVKSAQTQCEVTGSDYSCLSKGSYIKPHHIHIQKITKLGDVKYGILTISVMIQGKCESRSMLNPSHALCKKEKNLQNFLNNRLVG